MIRQKDGRRNRYRIRAHLPVPGPGTREPAIGEVVALFAAPAGPRPRRYAPAIAERPVRHRSLPVPPPQQITHSLER